MTLLEIIHKSLPGFSPDPKTIYTFRFVYYGVEDKNRRFSIISGLWDILETTFANVLADEGIVNCLAEYICEFNSEFCGVLSLCKNIEGGEQK